MNFVYMSVTDTLERLTEKTIKTYVYIYEHLIDEFDWAVLANDDTYIILENVREFLLNKCRDEKFVYGKILSYFKNKHLYTNGDNSRGFLQGKSLN